MQATRQFPQAVADLALLALTFSQISPLYLKQYDGLPIRHLLN